MLISSISESSADLHTVELHPTPPGTISGVNFVCFEFSGPYIIPRYPTCPPLQPIMAEDKEQTKFEDSCDIDEKQLLRKIDWHLIPGLALLLLLSFLDRINGDPFSPSTCLSLIHLQLETLESKVSLGTCTSVCSFLLQV